MAGTLAVSGASIPEDSDDFDTALDMAALGTGLDRFVVGRFTTTAARNAAIPSPARGQVCTVCASNGATITAYAYDGSAWVVIGRSPQYQNATSTTSTNVPTSTWKTVGVGTTSYSAGEDITAADGISPIVQVTGIYAIHLSVMWAAQTGGRRMLGWSTSIDTDPNAYRITTISNAGGGQIYQTYATEIQIVAGAGRVAMNLFQDSGSTIAVTDRRIIVRRVA